jgi:hypothetical protein
MTTAGMTAPKRKRKPLAQYRSSPEEIAAIDAVIKAIVEEERATISPTLRLSIRHIFYRVENDGPGPQDRRGDQKQGVDQARLLDSRRFQDRPTAHQCDA